MIDRDRRRPALAGWLGVALLALATIPAAATEAPETRGEALRPVFEEWIEPCCSAHAPVVEQGQPFRVDGEARPSHSFFAPATRRWMKAQAVYNPAAPVGTNLAGTPEDADLEASEDQVEVGAADGETATGPAGPSLDALAPNTSTRFDGINILSDTSLGLSMPPDTILGVSPQRILQGTNTALRLSGRNGANPQIVNLNQFFQQKNSVFIFDPKVVYDRLSGRFFVIAISQSDVPQSSFLYVAVSRNGNPLTYGDGDWCKYQVNSRRDGAWADFPALGMNEDRVAVSVNNFSFASGDFASPFVYAFDKSVMIDNARTCKPLQFSGFRPAIDPSGTITFTIQPALHYTSTTMSGNPLFFVSSQPVNSSNSYVLWRLHGTPLVLEKAIVSSANPYTVPPNAPQMGGDDLDSGDMRIQQVAYRDGRLWAVHSTGCNLGTVPSESCIRALEIQPTEVGGQVTFEETFGTNDWFVFWPGIAVNEAGDVVTTFQRSRANRYLDVAYNGKPAGAEGFDDIKTLKIGSCTLFNDPDNSGTNRTGDYVGVQTDPLDNQSFWIAGEFTGPLPVIGCDWKTHVARVKYGGGQSLKPSAAGSSAVAPAQGGSPGEDPSAPGGRLKRPELPPRLHLLTPMLDERPTFEI